MKLNFEDEPESESADNIKISQADFFYNEQVKIDEIYKIKVSIKFIKILSIISIIFCIIFTIFQIFQDYQFSSLQKQLNNLQLELQDLKSNNNYNYKTSKIQSDIFNQEKTNDDKDNINNNTLINIFTAETMLLREKFSKEILFLQECMIDTRIKPFEKKENPKITIIIPVYKTERYIKRLVQSIQKQQFDEMEIIFVEDLSVKKVFSKLEEISKIDKRIKIVKHEENEGLIHSYIKGIFNAKSKYLMFLEEEGMLLPYVKQIIDIIEVYNRDIHDFSSLKGSQNGITYEDKINDSEKIQPEISESYYNENFINDNPLMNKIYKTELIKNATNSINENYLSEKFDFHVDTLLYICFCSYAKSYKSIGNTYMEYHIKGEFIKSKENIERMFKSTVYLAQYIYELKYDYEEVFNQRSLLIINLFNWPLNYNIKISFDIEQAFKVVNLYINNKDISEENKRKFSSILRKINDRSIKKKK